MSCLWRNGTLHSADSFMTAHPAQMLWYLSVHVLLITFISDDHFEVCSSKRNAAQNLKDGGGNKYWSGRIKKRGCLFNSGTVFFLIDLYLVWKWKWKCTESSAAHLPDTPAGMLPATRLPDLQQHSQSFVSQWHLYLLRTISKHSCSVLFSNQGPSLFLSSICRLDSRLNGRGCWDPQSSFSWSLPQCTQDFQGCQIINITGAMCWPGSCRAPSWPSWWYVMFPKVTSHMCQVKNQTWVIPIFSSNYWQVHFPNCWTILLMFTNSVFL